MKSRCPGPLDDGGYSNLRFCVAVVAPSLVGGAATIRSSPTRGDATQNRSLLQALRTYPIRWGTGFQPVQHGLQTRATQPTETGFSSILQRVSCLHPVRPGRSMGGLATVCENVAGTARNVNDPCRSPGSIATRRHRPSTCATTYLMGRANSSRRQVSHTSKRSRR